MKRDIYRYLLDLQPKRQLSRDDMSSREQFEWAFLNACLGAACGVVLLLAIAGVFR